MHDEELKKIKKVLEKYQELGGPARNILTKIIKKPSGIWRGDLKKSFNRMNDKVLRDGINQLLDFKVIKREEVSGKVYYSLEKKHKWQLSLIARKQSDKLNLDSYGPEEIINESTSKSKTTIYGLNSNVFRAVVEGSHNTDINKKETLDFVRGIKAKEMFGEFFGAPLRIKICAKENNYDEKELLEESAEYHIKNYKLNEEKLSKNVKNKIKNMAIGIISNHRNTHLSFEEIGNNFVQKLLDLKKDHRFKKLEETYKKLLKNKEKGKINKVLKEFKEEFLLILNHCDIDKEWLEKAIFEFYGQGCGLFSTIRISKEKNKEDIDKYEANWKRNIKFMKTIDKLEDSEKDSLLNFLLNIIKQNISLYPTRVSVLCRVSSSDIMPLIEPKKQRKSSSHFPKN